MNAYLQVIDSFNLEPRQHQQELFSEISEHLLRPNTVMLGQASTGVGKTLATASAAIEVSSKSAGKNPLVVIATPTVALCREYIAIFGKLGVDAGFLLSYRNFFCKKRLEMLFPQYEVGSNEHKLLWTMVNWEGAIDEYITEYNELPLGLKQVDVCQSSYTVTEEYNRAREATLGCNIVVTTHAMLISDIIQSGRVLRLNERKPFMIVDEADALIDSLQEAQQRHFNIPREFSSVRDLLSIKFCDELDRFIMELKGKLGEGVKFTQEGKDEALNCLVSLYGILEKSKRRNLSEDDKRYFTEFKDYLEYMISDISFSDQVALGLTKINEEPTVAIYNPYFSRVFGGYLSRSNVSAALISGTLSINTDVMVGTEWVTKELKLDYQDVFKKEFTPEHFGELSLHVYRTSESMYEHDDDEAVTLSEFWLKDMARRIVETNGKTLVVTASFSEAEAIGELIGSSALVHRSGERLSTVKKEFVSSDKHQVLISPSAHTGINFTWNNRSVLKNIVITRLGFAPRNEVLNNIAVSDVFPIEKINALKQREYMLATNKVIRRSIQIMGRGIRHESDEIDLFILDNRFPLYGQLGSKFSSLKSIIPRRFSKQYREADVQEPMAKVATKEKVSSIDLSLIC
ncbi:DEAD/DEAH box helicase [Vibrio parahaemolyticus]